MVQQGDPNGDADGDGFTAAAGDCNDHDATIYPGAPELCDGHDHNCNHIVDDICDDDKDGWAARLDRAPTPPRRRLRRHRPAGQPRRHRGGRQQGRRQLQRHRSTSRRRPATSRAAATTRALRRRDRAVRAVGDVGARSTPTPTRPRTRSATLRQHYKPKAGANFVVLSTGIAADESEPGYASRSRAPRSHNDDPNPLR